MIWTLFVKQHNTTGLKYLGDPDEGNPFTYKGSGQYWLAHLRKHRKDFSTYIIGQYETQSELKEASNYYFDLWNVAESRNQKTGKGVFADDIK